jgi:DNA-binding IclR family transcriptional regulator
VLDGGGATVASIGVSMPVARFELESRQMIARCREAAATASRALGFAGG